jgi:hypothetical protein
LLVDVDVDERKRGDGLLGMVVGVVGATRWARGGLLLLLLLLCCRGWVESRLSVVASDASYRMSDLIGCECLDTKQRLRVSSKKGKIVEVGREATRYKGEG